MSWDLIPKPLQDALIELETLRRLWESTEEQVATLIDATIQRIADQNWPFWEDNEEAILQRDLTEKEMLRIARATTLLQAWAIFEDAASWTAEERRRLGQTIGKKGSQESFTTWAGRELALFAQNPWQDDPLEWMEFLGRLRSVLIHTNGQYMRLKRTEQERLDEWIAAHSNLLKVTDGRIDISQGFVNGALNTVHLSLSSLSEPYWKQG